MKKFLLYIFILMLGFSINIENSFAENSSNDDTWNDMIDFDRNWKTNQESVTDADFEKVMQKFEKKKKTKKYEFEPNETKDSLNDMSILNEIDNHSPTLLFPATVTSYEGDYIPAGYYKLNYLKTDNKHYIMLTQGRKVCAKLLMNPTSDDFKSESIQFAEIRPNNSETIKLIYGNLDLNLYKDLYIKY